MFQHAWPPVASWATRNYDMSQHVLADVVLRLDPVARAALDAELAATVTSELLEEVLALVPDCFLQSMNSAPEDTNSAALRRRYVEYLLARRTTDRAWWPVAAAA